MAQNLFDHAHFNSILPFLPPLKPSSASALAWPNEHVISTLETLSKGPSQSQVNSGKILFDTIKQLRESLCLTSDHPIAHATAAGYDYYFDQCMARSESTKFFSEVLPVLAAFLLRFPTLLESHYRMSDGVGYPEVVTCLRLLEPQQAGIVFLSQELIAALLACSLFCLFPSTNRETNGLQGINCDYLFANIYGESHINKIKCIIHYFERVCLEKPTGSVSFERKVLSMESNPPLVTYPTPELWANSAVPLCRFEVCYSGAIEDHSEGSMEVDFADEYIGGLTLTSGCEQEEIRFLINPGLIAAMIFLPIMAKNEAIEMVGAERFSNYTGYGPTFRYSGDHVDTRGADSMGRRKTRVVAIDALPLPGTGQYKLELLLREVNKALCGFLIQPNYPQQEQHGDIGVITGNWGCGVFGGDPEIKTMIQWLAASQASRPFICYYTFGLRKLQNLDQVCQLIISQNWTSGDLWNKLVDYSFKRANGETKVGFFCWLLPPTEHTLHQC